MPFLDVAWGNRYEQFIMSGKVVLFYLLPHEVR